MDDSHNTSRARQRQRRRNRQPMAVQKTDTGQQQVPATQWLAVLSAFLKEFRMHPIALKVIALPTITLIALFLINVLFGGRIPPNVFILDLAVGSLRYEDTIEKLEILWSQDLVVRLEADDNRAWTASPTELGLDLNAQATAEATDGIGLAGIPFGYSLEPIVSVDESIMRQYLETLADDVYIAPVNAHYEWSNSTVSGISGQDGTQLDIDATLANILQNPLEAVHRDVKLVTRSLPPLSENPALFLDTAQQFVTAPFELVAYDPFRDQYISLTATPEILSSWLEGGENSLMLRHTSISDYVDSLNSDPSSGLPEGSYLDVEEVIDAINQALASGSIQAQVRQHFGANSYEVVAGDTGYRIARKTGIPFFLVEAENSDRDLSVLSPGDIINLPSRDVTLPLPVISNKRIVVNLETQSLFAYEDGQLVFDWQISSGISEAPTSPGIFQILNHEPIAYGSSYTLCGDAGCGQWEMNWFMGIYEVVPGLINGFHGAVLLPNGAYLGGNSVGIPFTLGCVMSQDEQARLLYDWADDGTIVEIISSEYPPQSELARRAFNI